jgi:hypothetical protein
MVQLLVFLLLLSPLSSLELTTLYQKNYSDPCSPHEEMLVEHVKMSFEKAIKLDSKLSGQTFIETDASRSWRTATIPHYHFLHDLNRIPYYHLLNNLCTLTGASHLHVGLLAGDSFIAALYANQSLLNQQIGVDWFKECPESIFYANCNRFLNLNKCQLINTECFKVDKSSFKAPIDIYFYDADHSLLAHEKALTYYNDILSDTFILVIDDWHCPWIRGPTFKAFDKLGYSILYENTISNINAHDHGQYVAVIRKSHSENVHP